MTRQTARGRRSGPRKRESGMPSSRRTVQIDARGAKDEHGSDRTAGHPDVVAAHRGEGRHDGGEAQPLEPEHDDGPVAGIEVRVDDVRHRPGCRINRNSG